MNDFSDNCPVALILEDQPDLLKSRRNLFNVSGFQSICVRTAAEALREFIGTPAVDIIVADINLDTLNEDDVSGVSVATTIRAMRPDVPIVAVSAKVDSLSNTQRQPFTDSLVKGQRLTSRDYDGKLEQWRNEAVAYRERRSASSKRAIQALEADGSRVIDYAVLREFLPGRQADTEQTSSASVPSADEVLRAAGWWLQLIQAGEAAGDNTPSTRLAVPVWVRKEETDHIAVLHGFSFLSSRATEAAEAVEQLLQLMAAFHSGRQPLNVSNSERERLLSHLKAVFE
jgi:CheY-like chemotaxis protein